MIKRAYLLAATLTFTLLTAACLGGVADQAESADSAPQQQPVVSEPTQPIDGSDEEPAVATESEPATEPAAPEVDALPAWFEIPLTDVRTGETFQLSDLLGKTVIIESMAVWCPLCTQQQFQLAGAKRALGESVVVISLDTDPGENAELLARHAGDNGFDWKFVVSPSQMNDALVTEYGPAILSAPSTPIIFIDSKGMTHLTPYGMKSTESLVAFAKQIDS